MSEATLEAYIRQLLESHRTPQVTVAWQGGEPTLMKLEFFRRAVELVEKYRRPGQTVQHTFQTNGLLLDDDWCAFFKQHDFLVGLSVDGPRELHDTYRRRPPRPGHLRPGDARLAVPAQARGRLQHPVHGQRRQPAPRPRRLSLLPRRAGREVGAVHPDHRARHRADDRRSPTRAGASRPASKRLLYTQTGNLVTERTVGAEQYGRFLIDIFEEWVRHDVGQVYVQLFDVTLEAFFGRHLLCIHAPTCGYGPALEHNGDLYSCDHFVEPKYKLGNIHETHMLELVASPAQRKFGQDKRDTLTAQCRGCKVRNWCNGGCPKDRFALSRDGEPGQNYLCPGLELFFTHTGPTFNVMVQLLRQGRAPADVMAWVAARGCQARAPISPAPAAAAGSSASATATRRRLRPSAGSTANRRRREDRRFLGTGLPSSRSGICVSH